MAHAFQLVARRVAHGSLIAAGLVACATAPASATTTGRCARAHSKTVIGSGRVRVSVDRRTDRIYACWRASDRSRYIADADGISDDNSDWSIAGRHVAFTNTSVNRGTAGDTTVSQYVFDVRARRYVNRWRFTQYVVGDGQGPEPLQITGRKLRADGHVAFLVGPFTENPRSPEPHWTYQVIAGGDRGRRRVLDSGQDIDRTSFRATRSRIHWTRAGVERHTDFE